MMRTSKENMEPMERVAHELGVDIYGLKCDVPTCEWEDMDIPLDAYLAHFNSRCPSCGAAVLTPTDLLQVMSTVFGAAAENYKNRQVAEAEKRMSEED